MNNSYQKKSKGLGLFLKKSKGSDLFLHCLPPLANEAGKLNYPFNRRNLRGTTFSLHEKDAKPYWISPAIVASVGKALRKYAGHDFAKDIG